MTHSIDGAAAELIHARTAQPTNIERYHYESSSVPVQQTFGRLELAATRDRTHAVAAHVLIETAMIRTCCTSQRFTDTSRQIKNIVLCIPSSIGRRD